jgi:predicted transcriptional regulator
MINSKELEALNLLMNPVRFKIISSLREGPMYINEIANVAGVSRTTAAFHLRLLEAAGFIRSEFRIIHTPKSMGKAARFYALTPKVQDTAAIIGKAFQELKPSPSGLVETIATSKWNSRVEQHALSTLKRSLDKEVQTISSTDKLQYSINFLLRKVDLPLRDLHVYKIMHDLRGERSVEINSVSQLEQGMTALVEATYDIAGTTMSVISTFKLSEGTQIESCDIERIELRKEDFEDSEKSKSKLASSEMQARAMSLIIRTILQMILRAIS